MSYLFGVAIVESIVYSLRTSPLKHGFLRHRGGIYAGLNVAALLLCGYGAVAGNESAGTAVYVCLLFALCTIPLLWMERINDRFALLGAFMGTYFLLFGALSMKVLIVGSDTGAVAIVRDGFMSAARVGVLLGAGFFVGGYRSGAAIVPRPARSVIPSDWSNTSVLITGSLCWILGSACMAYYSLAVVADNTNQATAKGLASMGPVLTFAIMLGQMMQPLGLVVLAYGYAKNRTPLWLILVLTVIASQLVLGFVIDTKGVALLGILLVAFTQTFWDDKLPKGWVAGVLVFAIVLFPVFQAARIERGDRGLDRTHAVERLADILQRAWEAQDKESDPGTKTQSFLERSSSEATLEPIFDQVGADLPFLHGGTLVAIPYAFVPRLLIPDKEDVPVGQLYHRVFQHGTADDFTYISFSQLGELYWNFGWAGVAGGMLLMGLLLGIVGAKSSLAEVHSLTRLLVLLITIKTLCLGFGGGMAVSFVVWMRAMAAIGLLHLIFARPARAAQVSPLPAPVAPQARKPGNFLTHPAPKVGV